MPLALTDAQLATVTEAAALLPPRLARPLPALRHRCAVRLRASKRRRRLPGARARPLRAPRGGRVRGAGDRPLLFSERRAASAATTRPTPGRKLCAQHGGQSE